jgi:hypothetical protein
MTRTSRFRLVQLCSFAATADRHLVPERSVGRSRMGRAPGRKGCQPFRAGGLDTVEWKSVWQAGLSQVAEKSQQPECRIQNAECRHHESRSKSLNSDF